MKKNISKFACFMIIAIILYNMLDIYLTLISLCGILALYIEYSTIMRFKKDGESLLSPIFLAVTGGVFVAVGVSITILIAELVIYK